MTVERAELRALLAYDAISPRIAENFADFLSVWRLQHEMRRGDRQLTLWVSDRHRALYAVLTEGANLPERVVAADWLSPETDPRVFRKGGQEVLDIHACIGLQEGIFVTAFRAEPGAESIRFHRCGGEEAPPEEVAVVGNHAFIVDWQRAQPIAGFVAVRRAGQWIDVAVAAVPFTPAHLARAWCEHHEASEAGDRQRAFWIVELFWQLEGKAWEDAVFAVLRHIDAQRDGDALGHFGAFIYGNDASFYDRLAREGIAPETIRRVLAAERPEYLSLEARARYDAVMRKLGA